MSVFHCMYKYRFLTPHSSFNISLFSKCLQIVGSWMDSDLSVEFDEKLIRIAVCGWMVLRWEWKCVSIAACHRLHASLTHSVIKIWWLSLVICYEPTLLPNGISCILPSVQFVCIFLSISNPKRSVHMMVRAITIPCSCRYSTKPHGLPPTNPWNINSVLIEHEKFCSHGWWHILRFPLTFKWITEGAGDTYKMDSMELFSEQQ